MFKVNDLIVYGNDGICRVEQICTPDIPVIDKNKLYYVLKTLYHEGIIYAPIDTNVFMRPIITYETAQQLIDQIPHMEVEVMQDNNFRGLNGIKDYYKATFQTHSCEGLIRLIKTVYVKKNMAVNKKKKLGQTDESYMRKAEELLYGEFAEALKIPRESVKGYIEGRVKELIQKNQ